MRLPSAPEHPNFEETGPIRPSTGARDPSYPDRARIDSDVRYLLRPPSSPWITFDKDPKELDASTVSSAAPVEIIAAPVPEPSNVVVATDILAPDDSARSSARSTARSLADHDEPPVASSRAIVAAVGGSLGLAALILISVLALGKKSEPAPAAATPAPPMPTEVAPPNLDVPPPVVAPASTPAPPSTAVVEKTGWARLTIKGAAKGHRVYLDGKMLLGQGQRTFMIRCGDHTIAVGNKADARGVDIPCNGEYVVSK